MCTKAPANSTSEGTLINNTFFSIFSTKNLGLFMIIMLNPSFEVHNIVLNVLPQTKEFIKIQVGIYYLIKTLGLHTNPLYQQEVQLIYLVCFYTDRFYCTQENHICKSIMYGEFMSFQKSRSSKVLFTFIAFYLEK